VNLAAEALKVKLVQQVHLVSQGLQELQVRQVGQVTSAPQANLDRWEYLVQRVNQVRLGQQAWLAVLVRRDCKDQVEHLEVQGLQVRLETPDQPDFKVVTAMQARPDRPERPELPDHPDRQDPSVCRDLWVSVAQPDLLEILETLVCQAVLVPRARQDSRDQLEWKACLE